MKKLIALLLTAVLAAAALSGCGSSSDTASTGSDTKETLIMATNAEFPPYEYYDNGEIVGIDAEIAAAIADKLDMNLEINDMEFNSVIAAVQTGKASIAAAGLTVTDERKESVDFTDPYATGVQVIIVKDDSDIASADDLEGKKIGVQQSTTGDLYCTDDFGEDNVEKFDKGATAVQALISGKVDAVVIDNNPAKAFVAANEGLKILDTAYADEDYAIAISKDNPELLEKVNTALNELIADGTVQTIIDKYITAD